MRLRFVYPRFSRHGQCHPELLEQVPCNEYYGPPSLGIAFLAAVTPPEWEVEFRDDRRQEPGLDDELDLVAISCFTPSAERAMELADAYRQRGRKVVMGGVFPTMMPEEAAPHVDAIVSGEGEGVWRQVLSDAAAGELKPTYRAAPVDLQTLPLPNVELYMNAERGDDFPRDYPVQISRGCSFECTACVIPRCMGKTIRHMPLDHALGQIRKLEERGKLACLTEDTSFFFGSGTQRRFGELLDALIERGQQAAVSYVGTSMPLVLGTRDAFLDRVRRAGIDMFYLVCGFDPISQAAFSVRDPKAWQQASDAIRKCFDHGIQPYTSFLVGNDEDDLGTFDRILEFADATGVEKAEFVIRTPYPGTPAWHQLIREDRILHREWSLYNDAHVVFKPKQMTPDELLGGYLYLWREFYRTRQQLKTLGQRERTIQL